MVYVASIANPTAAMAVQQLLLTGELNPHKLSIGDNMQDPNILDNSATAEYESHHQKMMANYNKSKEGHIPGTTHTTYDATYTVQAHPHAGMWVKDEKETLNNPNMNNNSVRRKLAKNPKKYVIVNV